MPELLIRDMPPELFERLKASAAKHNRSISEEAIAFLEKALPAKPRKVEIPRAHKGRFPITKEFIDMAKREGREVKFPTPIKGRFPLTQEFLDKHKREGLP